MYRFAATLASKARVAKNSTKQGRTLLIDQSYGAHKVKNVGAGLIEQVANATNAISGDARTREIFPTGFNSVAAGMSAMDQILGMGVNSVGTSLKREAGVISTTGEIAQLRSSMELISLDNDKEKLQERLTELSAGVSMLKVGGAGEAKVIKKKDKFTDAFNATKAAVEAGIVPGGVTLLYTSKDLKSLTAANFHQKIGAGIIQNAFQMPVRTFASHAGVEGEQNITNTLRPLSPHLPIYKPQLSSTFSIFHRITGAFLSTMVLSFYLLTMNMGSICLTYENFYQFIFYSSKLALISLEITALALSYHIFNGIRHLWTDFYGFPFFGRKGSGALKALGKKRH